MERRIVNPWTWQDELGFVQANEVSGVERSLICAGQASVDENGNTVSPGNMKAQIAQSLDNLETVLNQAGFKLSDVVRLNAYTTDMDAFFEAYEVMATRLGMADCKFAGTLLGVSRLAFPDLMVELEATAVA